MIDIQHVFLCDHIIKNNINSQYAQYNQDSCPRCNGNGWYFSFSDDNTNQVSSASGMQKIAQDIIRKIYEKNGISSIIETTDSFENTRTEILNIIAEIENDYKIEQLQFISSIDGENITEDDLLERIDVTDVYQTDLDQIAVELTLYNMSNQSLDLAL